MNNHLPIAIIGAGPTGLAAAAHILERGLEPLILEAGPEAGHSVNQWRHVKMFSPWEYNLDPAAHRLLSVNGWQAPDANHHPTGGELVDEYLQPLAAVSDIARHLRFNHRVRAVSRLGLDRMKDDGRERTPFVLRVETGVGEQDILAQAVLDASGTWGNPNPAGANGLTVIGEREAADHTHYGIPDVTGRDSARYADRRVLVIGSGHSAFNVLQDLVRLREHHPRTRILWAIRRATLDRITGGGNDDQLRERGKLGEHIRALAESGDLHLFPSFLVDRIERTELGFVAGSNDQLLPPVDEIVVTTGFRSDPALLEELRLALDPSIGSPVALAPMIDPNLHSCGTVPPHGAGELEHPEPGLYIVGMKSYGRAPTFLLRTGYEQVRSVTAALAGDLEAARDVQLELPATGVCSSANVSNCCTP